MPDFEYPGVDAPLRHGFDRGWRPGSDPNYAVGFPEYSAEGWADILPIREVTMMILVDNPTDKPNWHQKVFGEDIVQKWRDEAREQPEDGLFARIMQDNVSKFIPKPIIEDHF